MPTSPAVPDFAHYSIVTAEMVAARCARGFPPTDEMLLKAFQSADPPLLPKRDAAAVVRILSRKRGRPPLGSPSTRQLTRHIRAIRRDDAPALYLAALANRIAKAKGFTERQRSERLFVIREKRDRDWIIRTLYPEFLELIKNDPPSVEHPIFGRLEVPSLPNAGKREIALKMIAALLTAKFYHPPTIARMRNILSEKPQNRRRR